MENLITELAIKINEFYKDYDTYGYGDDVYNEVGEDKESQELKVINRYEEDIASGNIEYLVEDFREIMTESFDILSTDEVNRINDIMFNLTLIKRNSIYK